MTDLGFSLLLVLQECLVLQEWSMTDLGFSLLLVLQEWAVVQEWRVPAKLREWRLERSPAVVIAVC